jgi:hypothetical protein
MREWSAADATYIRTVFSQPTGRLFLDIIKKAVPKIKAQNMEEVAVEALKKQGAEDIITFIESMIEGPAIEMNETQQVDLTAEGD